jgi:hypothetical protein
MSDLWRQQIEQVAEAYGLPIESLEEWLVLQRTGATDANGGTVTDRLGRFLGDFADILDRAAGGSIEERRIAHLGAGDLGAVAALFDMPGLEAWAREAAGEKGASRLTPQAAELLSGLATELDSTGDVDLVRRRDGEWAELPLAPTESLPGSSGQELPRSPPPEPGNVPPGSAASPGIPRFTALVVEAPSIGRQFLTRLLNHQGFSADVADNGYQAERALAGRAYDFVFVDLQLAQAGGTEWLTRRPEFAERTVFLNDSSASSAFRGLSPTALVVDNPPSEQEIEGILKSYSHRIHGRSR